MAAARTAGCTAGCTAGHGAARRGFTLVEVLVALMIMAVVAAMGWQGVAGMTRSREIGTAASERTLLLSTLIAQWEQDLGAVYDSPQLPGVSFDGTSLRLIRRSDSGVQVVVWSLQTGSWRRWAGPVVRRTGDLQQSWAASQQLQGGEPGQLKLLDGVSGWQIYFWRGQGWSNAQSSGDLAAAEATPVAATVATAASAPPPGASAPAADSASAPAGSAQQGQPRSQLPSGVRLLIELPEGPLQRDVMLPATP